MRRVSINDARMRKVDIPFHHDALSGPGMCERHLLFRIEATQRHKRPAITSSRATLCRLRISSITIIDGGKDEACQAVRTMNGNTGTLSNFSSSRSLYTDIRTFGMSMSLLTSIFRGSSDISLRLKCTLTDGKEGCRNCPRPYRSKCGMDAKR